MSMFDDKYFAYVSSSYGISAIVFIGLVVWLLAQYKSNSAKLAQLQEQGITRRSSKAKGH